MKRNYENPEIEFIALSSLDIISTSLGTEAPIIGDGDGIWDLDYGAES